MEREKQEEEFTFDPNWKWKPDLDFDTERGDEREEEPEWKETRKWKDYDDWEEDDWEDSPVSPKVKEVITSALRFGTALLLVLITCRFAVAYWLGYSEMGTIGNLVESRNWGLAFYMAAACSLILFSLISTFWAMSQKKRRNRRYDTGRGLFAFLCIGILCLGAGLASMIPDGGDIINAGKSFLFTISDCYGTILPLCGGGILCCLVRKFL
ncbi:hypothetical protein [Hominifimenecus sp. rT4P-3]|uniref:hypothetical protein n=1 Tax=Hominifimenecus sp. rT4P-3 TaxID=3242979 RepID=UPI003DA4B2F3